MRKLYSEVCSSRLLLAVLILAVLPGELSANTSSVFSPDVDAGEVDVEFRASYVAAEGSEDRAYNHRAHIQYALDDTWRLRLIGAQRRIGGDSLDYNYTRLEVQQQLLEDEHSGWDAALRYEFQIADGQGNPDRFRLGWTAKVDLDERWQLRGNALLGRQFGDNRASGVQVETRFQLTRAMEFGGRLGFEMFNDYNTTASFGSYSEQEHQGGPIIKFSVGNLNIDASLLFGLSDSAPDHNFRLHLIYPL